MKIMDFVAPLLGENRSKQFISELPKLTIRSLIIKIVKTVLIVLLSLVISVFIILVLKEILHVPISEEYVMYFIFLPVYLAMILASIRYFYKSFEEIKGLFTSLPIFEVFKDTAVIILLISILQFIIYLVYFSINPNLAKEASQIFNQGEKLFFSFDVDLLYSLIIIVFASFGEELFVRGGIYRGLRNNFSIAPSLIIASLLYAIPHSTSIFNLAVTFASGAVSVWYLEYKNNLLTLVLRHIIQDMFLAVFVGYAASLVIVNFVK